MQCQIHIQKGQLFFKSACQVHHSPERGFENGWRERRREKPETDRGGRSRRPGDIPAHLSDSHLPQRVNVPTALCLLHGRLAAPPLLVQSCIGALCLHWASGTHQSPQGSWRDRSASVCEAELWLYWWTVLPLRQPTTAWSAAGSRGGGRNAASAKVFLCTVPAALLCCLSVCQAVCLSVCLFECQETRVTSELCCHWGDCVSSVWLSSQKVRWIPEGSSLKLIGQFQSCLCCSCCDDSVCSTLMCWRENWSNTEVSDISLLTDLFSPLWFCPFSVTLYDNHH